jgi:hypothetical protein
MRRTILLLSTMALCLLVASGVALAVTKIGTDGPDTLRGTNGELSAMAHIHSPKAGVCCLRYVTGRGFDTFLPSPFYREAVSL